MRPDLFQIYCDLEKDITGFGSYSFSLYDGEMKCSVLRLVVTILKLGKSRRGRVCSTWLNSERLMEETVRTPWKDHPHLEGLDKGPGYAGFPVINSENFTWNALYDEHVSVKSAYW